MRLVLRHNSSVALLMSVGDRIILLMGDAENAAQANMAQDTLPEVEVYRVASPNPRVNLAPALHLPYN